MCILQFYAVFAIRPELLEMCGETGFLITGVFMKPGDRDEIENLWNQNRFQGHLNKPEISTFFPF